GKIRIYLDGAETPNFEWSFGDLFDGKMPPFVKPLVYRRDSVESASDCYLPIPFAKHIKITSDSARGQYYHFNYLLLPPGSTVASFRLPLSAEEQTALDQAAAAWSAAGQDPKPQLPGQKTITKSLTIRPGRTVTLCGLRGPGEIRSIKATVQCDQRYAWRKLVLRGEWDRSNWPQVLTPLGPFFGFDWETPEYASLIAGCRKGECYQYLPMPFRRSGKLSLRSYLEVPATVTFEIQWAPLATVPDDLAYFYARWRHEPDSTTFDYPFIETAGRGQFVGVSMPIDHPLGGWWGEGDEKVWVDDDDFPPWIGTGSEDYFGDAWGIRYLSGPSYGAAADDGHHTSNYRWHFMDMIPFEKRMRMTIENYGPNGQGPRGQYDYTSTAFWYQAESTPPFADLAGVKYTGGDDPNGPPKPMQYDPHVFADLNAESVRTYGLAATFTQQAETLLVKPRHARMVTDAKRHYEFDRERAVDFGNVKSGKHLADLKITSPSDAVYTVRLFTTPEAGIADLTLVTDGKPAAITGRPGRQILDLGGIFLKGGEHTLGLAAASDGRAIFDCLQLLPAQRVAGAIEAEEMTVLRATGGGPLPTPGDPETDASAGRVLALRGAAAGQGFVIDLGKRPALPYVLGVRPFLGPSAGIVQAFAGDKPIGPAFDLYAPSRRRGGSVLPLGPVPAGTSSVEIRVVAKNAASTGQDAELDYFRWEPDIIGPGTAEGVWAQVIGTHDCDYRPQDLGANYSGGHQLWVQPCNLNSWIDIALEIPKAGIYAISTRYTEAADYATVQAFLDGKPVGPAIDCYHDGVILGEPLTLTTGELTAGRHVLRFQAVGKNERSRGYLMGIDHVIVK
ncbi:MAG TPA: DUF2961 domain-containing protein, partial [Chthonomonadaceae bacterium]|nr:DUF2961 domain-containing protein [Chthonomonadaceae bacterium]